VLLELRVLLLVLDEEDGRRSIQGTATCLPEELELNGLELNGLLLLEEPEDAPLGLEPLPLLGLVGLPGVTLLPGLVLLGLVLLGLVLLGLVLLGEELELPLELRDRIANSILPELGLMMVSLIVPRASPVEPVT